MLFAHTFFILFDSVIFVNVFCFCLNFHLIYFIYFSLRILTGRKQSNKSPALTKSTNKGIWVVVTANQLFIRGS